MSRSPRKTRIGRISARTAPGPDADKSGFPAYRKLPFHKAHKATCNVCPGGTLLQLPVLRGRDFDGSRPIGTPSKLRRRLRSLLQPNRDQLQRSGRCARQLRRRDSGIGSCEENNRNLCLVEGFTAIPGRNARVTWSDRLWRGALGCGENLACLSLPVRFCPVCGEFRPM
jgi:hypothetical protein